LQKIRVKLAPGYNINIGAGIIADTGQILKELGFKDKAVIVTDPSVRALYGENLRQSLGSRGFKTMMLEVPAGEENKSLASAMRLYTELTDFGAERLTPVLALGGGVIGDLAGFVAATYMRGVPLIQIPTTLLAQVDSSIGGKVAVNHDRLKNKIGAFYQPRAVITDIETLSSLPQREIISGLGEVIKYAVIKDAAFFAELEAGIEKLLAREKPALENVVARCAAIKAAVVEKDERDTGLRNILNFGHTVGHALETISNYGIAHGQAVAIGMMAAAGIAQEMGIFQFRDLIRMRKLLKGAGLMTALPPVDVKKVMELMKRDKKVQGGKIRFILPRAIGEVFMTDEVNLALVEKALAGQK